MAEGRYQGSRHVAEQIANFSIRVSLPLAEIAPYEQDEKSNNYLQVCDEERERQV